MNWKGVALYGGLAIIVLAAVWFSSSHVQRQKDLTEFQNAPRETTIVVHSVNLPASVPTVTPNPAKAKVDTIQDTRAIDSLIAVNKDKDTFIRALLFTRTFKQTWESRTDSTSIVGRLVGVYDPKTYTAKTNVFVDSLTVPERVKEIIRTVTVYKTAWEAWIVSAVCVVITVLQMMTR
jgi:hypothetical protein